MPTMTADLLRTVGSALYGPDWQAPLATDLHIGLRTMQRWAAGDGVIPDRLAAELADICEAHGTTLMEIAARLRGSGDEANT